MREILGLSHVLDLAVRLVELIIVVLPLQVDSEGFHHTFEGDREIMTGLFCLFQACVLQKASCQSVAEFVSGLANFLGLDLVHDSLTLSAQDVLEPLQIGLRVDDGFEFLQREFVTLKHGLDRLFVQSNLVLSEQVHDFVGVKRS